MMLSRYPRTDAPLQPQWHPLAQVRWPSASSMFRRAAGRWRKIASIGPFSAGSKAQLSYRRPDHVSQRFADTGDRSLDRIGCWSGRLTYQVYVHSKIVGKVGYEVSHLDGNMSVGWIDGVERHRRHFPILSQRYQPSGSDVWADDEAWKQRDTCSVDRRLP
ncbi:hypothetical protein MPLB_1700045 [Mesorhizobium sp. ORS 3324]|nr:hypothetical protein MPLB_1700045 [Mesorhizobium sp. ORS 3324]